jgi:hypothetical protein
MVSGDIYNWRPVALPCSLTAVVRQLLASVAGGSAPSLIKFASKGPLKILLVKRRKGDYRCLREGKKVRS